MKCRPACGACCIAPSIQTPYFGMPNGKPANSPCVHLDAENFQCGIWNTSHYPTTCANFSPCEQFCGETRDDALNILQLLEFDTRPDQH